MTAPITQPHEILPTAAAIASAITMRTATGVAIVSANVTSELAPVSNGDAWASAKPGLSKITAAFRSRLQPLAHCDRVRLSMRHPLFRGGLHRTTRAVVGAEEVSRTKAGETQLSRLQRCT